MIIDYSSLELRCLCSPTGFAVLTGRTHRRVTIQDMPWSPEQRAFFVRILGEEGTKKLETRRREATMPLDVQASKMENS